MIDEKLGVLTAFSKNQELAHARKYKILFLKDYLRNNWIGHVGIKVALFKTITSFLSCYIFPKSNP